MGGSRVIEVVFCLELKTGRYFQLEEVFVVKGKSINRRQFLKKASSNERFINDDQANQMLFRPMHNPWHL